MKNTTDREQSLSVERHLALHGCANPANYYGAEWGATSEPRFNVLKDWLEAYGRYSQKQWLEIGCGGGRWTKYMVDTFPEMTLDIVDATPAAELLTRAYADADDTRLGEFYSCPSGYLPSKLHGTYDLVFSFDVFVHFSPVLFFTYLGSIYEALKPGGYLIFNYGLMFPRNEQWVNGEGCFHYYTRTIMESWAQYHNFLPLDTYDLPGGYGSQSTTWIKPAK